jgi:hypothetical protein
MKRIAGFFPLSVNKRARTSDKMGKEKESSMTMTGLAIRL